MKKDPDAYRAKMEAMEAARMRMQEKYNQVERTVVLLVWCCLVMENVLNLNLVPSGR